MVSKRIAESLGNRSPQAAPAQRAPRGQFRSVHAATARPTMAASIDQETLAAAVGPAASLLHGRNIDAIAARLRREIDVQVDAEALAGGDRIASMRRPGPFPDEAVRVGIEELPAEEEVARRPGSGPKHCCSVSRIRRTRPSASTSVVPEFGAHEYSQAG